MKRLRIETVFAAVVLAAVSWAEAKAETVLNFSNWAPPTHHVTRNILQPWAAAVEKETQGRVRISFLPKPLGDPAAHFDLVEQGVVDLAFGVHGYQPSRFELMKFGELPLLGDKSLHTSVALWRVFTTHLVAADPHEGVQLLGLMTHGPGQIHHSSKLVQSTADLAGQKIRTGGPSQFQMIEAMGGVPLSAPATSSYEMLSGGIADGVLFSMDLIPAFDLTKLVKYHTTVPGGMYTASFFLIMNEDRFEGLPEEDREAILRVSGEAFATLAGRAWDSADAAAREKILDEAGIIEPASDELMSVIRDLTARQEAEWIEIAAAKGLDGAAILAAFRKEIAVLAEEN